MLMDWLRGREAPEPWLKRGRIVLRMPRNRDWPAWSRVRSESRSFLEPWEPSWPPDALARSAYRRRVRQAVEDAHLGLGYSFLIWRREDEALLGGISMTQLRRGVAQSASLGYWMAEQHAGQGYMSETLRAVIDFGFDRLKLHRLEAACIPTNEASAALLRKSGFHQEGYAREYLRIDGAWRDHLLFAMLESDPRPEPGPPDRETDVSLSEK